MAEQSFETFLADIRRKMWRAEDPVGLPLGRIANEIGAPEGSVVAANDDPRLERRWWEQNKDGRLSPLPEVDAWHLWNFGIGDTELTPEHVGAINEVIVPFINEVKQQDPFVRVAAMGFASSSGPEQVNLALARDRAAGVAQLLRGSGEVKHVSAAFPLDIDRMRFTTPESSSVGERMARERRVEVGVFYVHKRAPEPPGINGPKSETPRADGEYGLGIAHKFVELKHQVKVADSPNGDLWLVFEASGTVSTTEGKPLAEIELDNLGQIKAQIFDHANFGLVIEASTESASIGLEGFPFSLIYDPEIDPLSPSIKYTLPSHPVEYTLVEDGDLVVKFTGKIEVSAIFTLTELIKNRLAPALAEVASTLGSELALTYIAPVGGGVLGTFGLLLATSAIVEAAHQSGQDRGMRAYRGSGFALRIAAAVVRDAREHNRAVFMLESFAKLSLAGYEEAYAGWMSAAELAKEAESQRDALRTKHGTSVETIMDSIRRLIASQDSWGPDTVLPETIDELL